MVTISASESGPKPEPRYFTITAELDVALDLLQRFIRSGQNEQCVGERERTQVQAASSVGGAMNIDRSR